MLKRQLIKKIGWISLLVFPTVYIPSIIAYKTINYLNSGVDIVSDNSIEEEEPESKININDHIGLIDIGPVTNISVFNIIQRVNLIKHLDFDYKEFDINILENNVVELTIKEDSTKYTQDEVVLVEYRIDLKSQLEFKSENTTINFSLLDKVDMVKFDREDAYIDKDNFELIFSKRFLKLGPLTEKIELSFSYDQANKPKNVKAIYQGFDIPFEWSYSIGLK